MKRLASALKIFLIPLSAISVLSCSGAPEFPLWRPYLIIPSQGKKIQCKIIDKDKMLFECEKASTPLDGFSDGSFCATPEETKAIINWAVDMKKHVEKNCNRSNNAEF